jgi:hypothetical protein
MGIMARTFRVVERGQYAPHRCIVTSVTGKPDAPLIDLGAEAEYYGRVYLSYNIFVAIADQLGFVHPDVANALRTENETIKKRLDRIPAVTERLVNDIRDISISVTADLLSDPTPIVLADDEKPKQGNSRANLDYFGDNDPVEHDSEPSSSEGPTSVSAGNGSKRKPTNSPRTNSSAD